MDLTTGSVRIQQQTHPLDGRPMVRIWAPETLEVAGGFCRWFDTVQDRGAIQAWSSQPVSYLVDDLGGGRARILIGDLPRSPRHDLQALCEAEDYWRSVIVVDVVDDAGIPQLWVRDIAGGSVGSTDDAALELAAHVALCSSLVALEGPTTGDGSNV